ncbi:UNVERIFIED_CONTAM: Squamosa promoter-binding-like protein 7 [Sesamum indicum]
MASAAPHVPPGETASSSLFDWSDFLDFNLDETLDFSFPQPELGSGPEIERSQPLENSGRVRKRDPRLVCSNFLAGRVPCACPELDEQLAEEELALPGKKRARMVKLSGGAPVRCQVPGCEADITELKGYHKRHRVCLRCANASAVVLDGESKRYCQQCGKFFDLWISLIHLSNMKMWCMKSLNQIVGSQINSEIYIVLMSGELDLFHLLSDFDEGKRSCRRKLERHNNRRRRRPSDSRGGTQKEAQQISLADDVSGDDDTGKDGICRRSQTEEQELLLESDAPASMLCSALGPENPQSDSVASFAASDKMRISGQTQNPKYKHSPPYSDNKNTFSSMCPAGRISFKLYDWNPAEFPRRLRHQIFQWLANMPIELEGYIRPGCTILTAFIAMPKPTWVKVENQSGLSNFIPVLVGDKETCAEMEILQQKFDSSLSSQDQQQSPPRPECEVFASRQAQLSEFVLDVAWSLKKPVLEQPLTSSHIQRFNNLLNCLIEKESSVILERVFCNMKFAMGNNLVDHISDADMRSLHNNMGIAQSMLDRKLQDKDFTATSVLDGNVYSQSFQKDDQCAVLAANMGGHETRPLLNGEVIMNVSLQPSPQKSFNQLLTRTSLPSRPLIMAIAVLGICVGVCAVVLHPQRVSDIATTIRRCLFDSS